MPFDSIGTLRKQFLFSDQRLLASERLRFPARDPQKWYIGHHIDKECMHSHMWLLLESALELRQVTLSCLYQ